MDCMRLPGPLIRLRQPPGQMRRITTTVPEQVIGHWSGAEGVHGVVSVIIDCMRLPGPQSRNLDRFSRVQAEQSPKMMTCVQHDQCDKR